MDLKTQYSLFSVTVTQCFCSVRAFSLLTAICSHRSPLPCLCFSKIVKCVFTFTLFPHLPSPGNGDDPDDPGKYVKSQCFFGKESRLTLHDLTKSWNIFKWPLITQFELEWLPVMCWPFRVQSIHGCLSSKKSNCHSWPFLYSECEPGPPPYPPVLKPHNMPNNCTAGKRECTVCAYSITTPLPSHMD